MTYTLEANSHQEMHAPFTDAHEAVEWAEAHVAEVGWVCIHPTEEEGE